MKSGDEEGDEGEKWEEAKWWKGNEEEDEEAEQDEEENGGEEEEDIRGRGEKGPRSAAVPRIFWEQCCLLFGRPEKKEGESLLWAGPV